MIHSYALLITWPPIAALFPYTTLFRSYDPYRIEGIAHQTQDVLARVARFARLEDALLDCVHVVGFTARGRDRKSTRLNSSHTVSSYAGFCLKKKKLVITQRLYLLREW